MRVRDNPRNGEAALIFLPCVARRRARCPVALGRWACRALVEIGHSKPSAYTISTPPGGLKFVPPGSTRRRCLMAALSGPQSCRKKWCAQLGSLAVPKGRVLERSE